MMASEQVAYNKEDLRGILKAFKAMDDEAVAEAKTASSALAEFVKKEVTNTAGNRGKDRISALRIAEGATVSKSSKIGEISYGFSRQKFSGGGTTQQLWGGNEFGSNKFKQFPIWSGKEGRGSKGWFIYPTLRKIQPDIVKRWEEAFSDILKKWA
jgi:hypothetical protein